jgi:hypothetical protein
MAPPELLTSDLRHAASLDLSDSHAAAQIHSNSTRRPSGPLLLTAARRYNRAMPYPRTHLAGLLASLAGVLLLLSEMAFAQRSGVRSGVIGNVPAHQRIAQQCDRWGLPWCPNWKSSP